MGFVLAFLFLVVGITFASGGAGLWWDMHGLEQGHKIQGRVLSSWVESGPANDDCSLRQRRMCMPVENNSVQNRGLRCRMMKWC